MMFGYFAKAPLLRIRPVRIFVVIVVSATLFSCFRIHSVAADTICGPNAYSSEYVKPELEWEENEYSGAGGTVKLTRVERGSLAEPHSDIILERKNASNEVISKSTFDTKSADWSVMGFFADGGILILADQEDVKNRAELLHVNAEDKITWRQELPETIGLGRDHYTQALSDKSLMVFSQPMKEGSSIVEVAQDQGIVFRSQLGDTSSQSRVVHTLVLSDGSLVITKGGFKEKQGHLYQTAGVIYFNPDRTVRWQRSYTNGFDDDLGVSTLLSNGNIQLAGHTHRNDRYEGSKKAFWLVEIDKKIGKLVSQKFLHEPDGVPIDGAVSYKRDRQGQLLVSWEVQGPKMNDAQSQVCTYLAQ